MPRLGRMKAQALALTTRREVDTGPNELLGLL